MEMLIKLILVLLYFLIGAWLFQIAIQQLGGKEMYLEMIRKRVHNIPAYAVYIYALVVTIVIWPWYLWNAWRKKK